MVDYLVSGYCFQIVTSSEPHIGPVPTLLSPGAIGESLLDNNLFIHISLRIDKDMKSADSLVWPNGIVVYLEALLLYVILISLFEHSTSKIYPAFANRSMKCGILRGSTGLFIFFTSILGNNSVGFGRIKTI